MFGVLIPDPVVGLRLCQNNPLFSCATVESGVTNVDGYYPGSGCGRGCGEPFRCSHALTVGSGLTVGSRVNVGFRGDNIIRDPVVALLHCCTHKHVSVAVHSRRVLTSGNGR